MKQGSVYGLVASDEPLQIRYVGETEDSKRRLGQYLNPNTGISRRLRSWIDDVIKRGARVEMVILGRYPVFELGSAEQKWIAFWDRYCDLLNYHFRRW